MEWRDEGVVISVRTHGETSAVAEIFTRRHGRHLGLVHGGRSRRMRPVLQLGNHLDVGWRARLSEHLGQFKLELRRGVAAIAMGSAERLAALTSMSSMLRLLAERDPHENLFEVTLFVLGYLDDDGVWPALVVRWELALLDELGFGLDLTECAATGAREDLVYVSPKSGRAVSREAGAPYKDRLLALPGFLNNRSAQDVKRSDLAAGLALTAHFLETRVYRPREELLPETRVRLASMLQKVETS